MQPCHTRAFNAILFAALLLLCCHSPALRRFGDHLIVSNTISHCLIMISKNGNSLWNGCNNGGRKCGERRRDGGVCAGCCASSD